jgi:hypothetical protein
METIIVFIDDADHATQLLLPQLAQQTLGPTRWVLVGCAPRVTRHISRFVTQSARAGWRGSWADKVFARLMPQLEAQARPQDTFMLQIAPPRQSLDDLRGELTRQYSPRQVLDARRPRLAQDLQPLTPAPRRQNNGASGYAAALAGVGWFAGFD